MVMTHKTLCTVHYVECCYIIACGIENCINCDLPDVCLQCVEGYHPYQHSNSGYECITEEEFEGEYYYWRYDRKQLNATKSC